MTDSLSYDGTLRSFFFEQLGCAQERRGEPLTEEVEAYVVNLLAVYARRTDAAGRTSRPLATEYLRARQTGAAALREVGDRALYIAGVVPRSLERSPVGVDYVQSIGCSAYREVSSLSSALEVFDRLADSFARVTDLLGDVVDPTRGGGAENLLEVYERWRRHRRPRDAERLIAAGVLLDPERIRSRSVEPETTTSMSWLASYLVALANNPPQVTSHAQC